jgi:hypothetical protein
MVVGVFCGLFIRYGAPGELGPKVAQLDPKIFFLVFLPCIVFDAAYNCNKVQKIIFNFFSRSTFSEICSELFSMQFLEQVFKKKF